MPQRTKLLYNESMFFSIITAIIIFFSFPQPVQATYEPLSVPNNKYGIHIAEMTDLKDAAALVNSQNGDWGYVTLVIQDGDRNTGKWQELGIKSDLLDSPAPSPQEVAEARQLMTDLLPNLSIT